MDIKTLRMWHREGGDNPIRLMRFDKNLEYYFLESFFVFLGNFKVWIMREHVNDHFKQDMDVERCGSMQQTMPKSDLEKFDYGCDLVYVISRPIGPCQS